MTFNLFCITTRSILNNVDNLFRQLPAKKQLPVIPRIIRDKDWRIESLQRAVNEGTASDEQKALLALLLEGPGQFQTASTSTNSTIEIRPQGFGDEEEPLDVEPNYDAISYADFGAAFLRGRGWKKEEGIGRTNKQVVPLTVHSKPKSFKMPKAEGAYVSFILFCHRRVLLLR